MAKALVADGLGSIDEVYDLSHKAARMAALLGHCFPCKRLYGPSLLLPSNMQNLSERSIQALRYVLSVPPQPTHNCISRYTLLVWEGKSLADARMRIFCLAHRYVMRPCSNSKRLQFLYLPTLHQWVLDFGATAN